MPLQFSSTSTGLDTFAGLFCVPAGGFLIRLCVTQPPSSTTMNGTTTRGSLDITPPTLGVTWRVGILPSEGAGGAAEEVTHYHHREHRGHRYVSVLSVPLWSIVTSLHRQSI